MRTTIDLPEDLFREAKTRAVQEGTTMKRLMTQFIRAGLREHRPIHAVGTRRPLPPSAIPRRPDSPLVCPMSNRQLHRLLEEEDLVEPSDDTKGA